MISKDIFGRGKLMNQATCVQTIIDVRMSPYQYTADIYAGHAREKQEIQTRTREHVANNLQTHFQHVINNLTKKRTIKPTSSCLLFSNHDHDITKEKALP